ncbi:hypothetical protein OROHE_006891 [Orobanche hederae]
MADAVSHTSKPQKLPAHQVTSANNPGKYTSSFLYKAALITVFLILLHRFPSIAPEFLIQTLHARSWELLQLILVGIFVSYGLFSKRNDETEKDHGGSKPDNPQSYVARLLQVPSVFGDESECCQTTIEENNKVVETLNSKYTRGEPVVVVVKQNSVVELENGTEICQKPLLLPVRSLKQRIAPEWNELDLGDESGGKTGSITNPSRFNSSSRKPRNLEVGGLSYRTLDDKLDENVAVLCSPIPWRSRSARMEVKEHQGIQLEGAVKSTSFLSSSSSKNLSNPRNLTPSTSFPSLSLDKSGEDDLVRKSNYYSPPPPPPPPPPLKSQFLPTSMLSISKSSFTNTAVSPKNVLRPSVPTEELSESGMEELPKCGLQNDSGVLKSVRTYRLSELEKNSMDCITNFFEKMGYTDTMSNDKLPEEELVEKFMTETSDENLVAESTQEGEGEEEDYINGISSHNREAETTDNNGVDLGPDVDKKADEFIAKFREQIRLQSIESIKRSTAQHVGMTFS